MNNSDRTQSNISDVYAINTTRPPSSTPHKFLASLTSLIRKLLRGDRFAHQAETISRSVAYINKIIGKKSTILDYGCGNMALAEHLHRAGLANSITCVDTYDSQQSIQTNAITYQKIEDFKLKFENQTFDLAMVINVLHHAEIKNANTILQDLSKRAQFILVMDHFEYSFFSRQVLRMSDWFGNYAYGVSIPKYYFTRELWRKNVEQSGLQEITLKVGVKVYNGIFGLILPSKYHFISILRNPSVPLGQVGN